MISNGNALSRALATMDKLGEPNEQILKYFVFGDKMACFLEVYDENYIYTNYDFVNPKTRAKIYTLGLKDKLFKHPASFLKTIETNCDRIVVIDGNKPVSTGTFAFDVIFKNAINLSKFTFYDYTDEWAIDERPQVNDPDYTQSLQAYLSIGTYIDRYMNTLVYFTWHRIFDFENKKSVIEMGLKAIEEKEREERLYIIPAGGKVASQGETYAVGKYLPDIWQTNIAKYRFVKVCIGKKKADMFNGVFGTSKQLYDLFIRTHYKVSVFTCKSYSHGIEVILMTDKDITFSYISNYFAKLGVYTEDFSKEKILKMLGNRQ